LCVVALWAGVAAGAELAPNPLNLLTNSGFEELAADGSPVGWTVWPAELPEPGAVSIDGQVGFLGSHSLRLRHANDMSYTRGQQEISVQPGRKYAFTVRIKGEGITCQTPGWGARLWIDGPNPCASEPLAGTFDWTTVTVGPVSFGQVTRVTVMCYLYQARGTVWFDDAMAVEVTPEWEKLQQQVRCLDLLLRDVRLAREAVQEAGGGAALETLESIRTAARREDMPSRIDLRAGPPYFPLQARVLAVLAQVNAGRLPAGTRLAAWSMDPYARLPHLGLVPVTSSRDVRLLMGQGEIEAGALALCNLTPEALTAHVRLEGFTGADAPRVVFRQAVHVSKRDATLWADPLPRLQQDTISLPSGLFRLLWIEVDSATAKPGVYTGEVRLSAAGGIEVVAPLQVEVLPVPFPVDPPIVTWNYAYQIYTPVVGRWPQALADLTRHHINAYSWLSDMLPWPTFSAAGEMQPLNWTGFDQGLKDHPNARWLLLETGLARKSNLQLRDESLEIGSAEWERRWTRWFPAVLAGLKQRGFGTDRVAWYLADEPGTWDITNAVVTGGKIIKKIAPAALVMENPYAPTTTEMLQAMDPYVDIWCPELTQVKAEGLNLFRQRNRALWSYQVIPGDGDPFVTCRLSFWYCWYHGMTGQGFWSYSDGTGSVWDPFDAERHDYATVYDGDPAELIPSRRWEGWREGVEDYTYLWLLRQAVTEGRGSAATRAAAEQLLATRVQPVLAQGSIEALQSVRTEVLRLLVAVGGGH
jgi:hypothetical protein